MDAPHIGALARGRVADERRDGDAALGRLASGSERQRLIYETVLNNTPDFVYVFGLDHRVLYANEALIRMWGRGEEGAIGKTFLEIGYEPWHAAMHDREIDQVRATRQPIRGEVPFTGTNGRRQYEYIFVPVIGADGEVEAVAGTTRDVTERKEKERQLREGQEQLDFALAAADLGQWSLNLVDYTAERTLRHDQIFGYDTLLPHWTFALFLDHVVPEERASVEASFQQAVATGSAWDVECRIRRRDGEVRHIWSKGLARRDADGHVERMLGIVGDITDRRRATERQAFQIRLADALRPLSDPVDVQAEASRVLGEQLGANRVVYFEMRDDDYVIARDFTAGVKPLAGRYPVSAFGPALLTALRDGRTVIEADATAAPDRPLGEQSAYADIQVRGHVDVPLVKDGRLVAGMTVHVSERREWTSQDVALIEDTAERTWAAVERVRAEGALRRSEERLRMALSAAKMVAWEYDPLTGVVVTSDNAPAVYGFPSDEVVRNVDRGLGLLHPDDADRHRMTLARAAESGEGFTSHFRMIRPDTGAVLWMEERGHAVRDKAGTTLRLIGVNMDISARKAAEETLRESEERLAFVRRSSGVGFWYCDLPFDVLQWDDLVKSHFHLPADAVVTIETFYDRIHPDDREPTRQAIAQSIAERTAYNVEYRTVDPDTGAVTWVRAMGRTTYAVDGTPIRFDGVTLDVSDQKRAEVGLRESEERFRLMADAAPVMIWMSGEDQLVSWYNRPWLEFTGRTMEEEVGHGATEVVHPDDLPRTLPLYIAAFEARARLSMEYRLRRHDGEYRWFICNAVPRYRADGGFAGYIGSCFDITDFKNAQAALRDADRRKDEFLATLSHELRNPLAPLRNGLQVIRLAGDVSETVERTRSMMERQVTHLVRLVDDLLDVSRVTSDKLELRQARIELRRVIDAATETSRPVIDEAAHRFTVAMPDEPIWVNADMTRLAQVVSNLLNNSAKYTPRGGRIALTVRRDGDWAVISVADDGIGIPPAMLDKVFRIFAQVDRALEKTTGGLGIGLSLVKRLVEMHGGSVAARSDGAGKGSEFVVRIPLANTAAQTHAPVVVDVQNVTPGHKRILIADDNVDAADALGQLLEMQGHDVRTVNDGLEAVDAAATFRPDVVLLDIGMPKLNGYEAARRIRSNAPDQSILLVALTGWSQFENRSDGSDARFDHHFVKPVDFSDVLTLLSALPSKT